MPTRRPPRRPGKPAGHRNRTKKRVAWAAGGAVGVAGLVVAGLSLVAGVAGPLPEIMKPETKPTTLEIEKIGDDGVTHYVLPADAKLEEMPYEPSPGCSPKMHEWLRANGTVVPKYYRMTVRNTAATGAMLTLDNVRVREAKDEDPEVVMLFDCPSAGIGDIALLNLHLDRAGAALLVDKETDTERPFTFNLEPGEQGTIELRMPDGSGRTRSGEVVVDVTTGPDTTTVPLKLGADGGKFRRPGIGRTNGLIISASSEQGVFYCERSGLPNLDHCSASEARQKVREAAEPGFGRPFAARLGGQRVLTTDAEGKRLELLDGTRLLSSASFEQMGISNGTPLSGECHGPLCVVGVGVGAHSVQAVLVRIDGDRIVVLDAKNALSGSDALKVVDVTADGVPEVLGQQPVGVYAEGHRRWITWQIRDDQFVQTGCGPVDGPQPATLMTGDCRW